MAPCRSLPRQPQPHLGLLGDLLGGGRNNLGGLGLARGGLGRKRDALGDEGGRHSESHLRKEFLPRRRRKFSEDIKLNSGWLLHRLVRGGGERARRIEGGHPSGANENTFDPQRRTLFLGKVTEVDGGGGRCAEEWRAKSLHNP